MTVRAIRMVSPVAAGVLAAWGGVLFGLLSCGGYVRHWQLFEAFLAAAMIATVIAPPWQLRSWLRRGVFVVALACGFGDSRSDILLLSRHANVTRRIWSRYHSRSTARSLLAPSNKPL
jgi:hypothetical protein